MTRHLLAGATLAAALTLSAAQAGAEDFSSKLSGFNEIGSLAGPTGAILSEGTATLKMDLNRGAKTLAFKLTYSGLSSNVVQAHIHFGKVHVAGGVIVFFCGPATSPAHQVCPPTGGTVTGTIAEADILAIPSQNVPAKTFDALTDALVSHTAYANIHTVNFPAGEIRGEIRRGEDDDDR
jgi:CHRD domain-containing protein